LDMRYNNKVFGEVWKRVGAQSDRPVMPSPPPAPDTPDESSRLRGFMTDEANGAHFYAEMARKTTDKAQRSVFMRLSNEEKHHLRKLQAEYYIESGSIFTPTVGKTNISSVTSALRERYMAETEGASEYRRAALETKSARLRDVYSMLAADESRHAETVAGTISRMFLR